ncbi:MAG: hypothetical protein AAFN78_00990 [Pseudomonadota bacterium]
MPTVYASQNRRLVSFEQGENDVREYAVDWSGVEGVTFPITAQEWSVDAGTASVSGEAIDANGRITRATIQLPQAGRAYLTNKVTTTDGQEISQAIAVSAISVAAPPRDYARGTW